MGTFLIYVGSLIVLFSIAKQHNKLDVVFVIGLIFLGPFAALLLLRKPKTKKPKNINEILPEIKMTISKSEEFSSDYQYVPPKDERKAECPNCQSVLRKVPGSKTKCPNCGKYMLVRTEPHSRTRVVVTEAEAEKIDDEIAKLNGTYDQIQEEKTKREKVRNDLRTSFKGIEPSEDDIEWRILNQDGIKYAKQGDWVSYSLVRVQMSNALAKKKKFKNAISTLFESMIIDLNGMQDMSTANKMDSEMRKMLNIELYKPDEGQVYDWAIDEIIEYSKELNLTKDTIEAIFYETYDKMHFPRFPISKEDCWKLINVKLDIKML